MTGLGVWSNWLSRKTLRFFPYRNGNHQTELLDSWAQCQCLHMSSEISVSVLRLRLASSKEWKGLSTYCLLAAAYEQNTMDNLLLQLNISSRHIHSGWNSVALFCEDVLIYVCFGLNVYGRAWLKHWDQRDHCLIFVPAPAHGSQHPKYPVVVRTIPIPRSWAPRAAAVLPPSINLGKGQVGWCLILIHPVSTCQYQEYAGHVWSWLIWIIVWKRGKYVKPPRRKCATENRQNAND